MPAGRWEVRPALTVAELLAASPLFDEPVTPESAGDYLRRPGHRLLLAFEPDHPDGPEARPVGFVSTVTVVHPDKGPEQLVYELGVAPEWRRRGVASALLAAVTGEARRAGDRGVWVLTEPDNVPALAAYRRAGARAEATVILTWEFGEG